MTLVDFDPFEEYDPELITNDANGGNPYAVGLLSGVISFTTLSFTKGDLYHYHATLLSPFRKLTGRAIPSSMANVANIIFRVTSHLDLQELLLTHSGIWFAQDRETRLVAIKRVKKDTEEYHMEDFSAVVMPNLYLIGALRLQGLVFLHDRNIMHRVGRVKLSVASVTPSTE
ncbi:hypothetical protein ARMGADRAFT_1061156 [Armillaria gallica]|uniref:Protein kinase domain-containing protein n=1 Tax=Armillaria gallica TaxID=47427 RepID=A0A2H3DMQ6_ARMGA|nr:hypothetical protein ARMGADRAFT_1061156 [Armillaria gallica]